MGLGNRIFASMPDSARLRLLAAQQPLREPEIKICREVLASGGTAVDIGAWWGTWSYHMAKYADRVLTIEPVPYVAAALRASLPEKVEVLEVAATNRTGTSTLWLPSSGIGAEGRSSLTSPTAGAEPIEVETVRVDDLDLNALDLIKIDVEGHEMDVVEGARETLLAFKPHIVIELEQRFHDEPLAAHFASIESLGYRGTYLDGRSWRSTSDFDVERWQTRHQDDADRHGYLRSLFLHSRYRNNFVFRPT